MGHNGFQKYGIPAIAILCVGVLIANSNAERARFSASVALEQDKNEARVVLPEEPVIDAQAYIVRFLNDEKPVLERRAWKPLAPASLTKLLTVLLADEQLAPREKIIFSDDVKKLEQKLSAVPAGSVLSRDDVSHLAIIESDNDAAAALAEEIGRRAGGNTFAERMEVFRILMNKRAQEIGMTNSHFVNPTGLDASGHTTTVADLAQLVEYIWKHDQRIWDISCTIEGSVRAESGKTYAFSTTDDLLKELPALRGGKTGFTDKAQGALILLYPIKEKIAVIALIGSQDRFGDGKKIINWLDSNF